MSETLNRRTRHSVRTRAVVYGGLLASALVVLFGPQLAEWGLAVLGCRVGAGVAGVGCDGVLSVPARPLAALAVAVPPLETGFVFVERLWPLLLLWAGAILLSVRADRIPAAAPLSVDAPPMHAATATVRPRAEDARARWVADREREQALDDLAAQRSLHQQLMAETRFIGSIALLCWLLFCGLVGFCLAFGLPLLGGISTEYALDLFGCGHASGPVTAPLLYPCAGLELRFAPYREPFFGALLSPVWLFTQFGDVLLIWFSCIVVLAVLPVLRLGIRPVIRAYPVMSLTLFATATLAAIAMTVTWLAPTTTTGGRFHEPVPAIAFLESMAVVVVAGVLVLAIATAVLIAVVVLARRSPRPAAVKAGNPD